MNHDTLTRHIDTCNSMEVGQIFGFPGRDLGPDNPFTGEPAIERFKSSLLGMNFGGFEVEEDPITRAIRVWRLAPGPTRIRQDWDRRDVQI